LSHLLNLAASAADFSFFKDADMSMKLHIARPYVEALAEAFPELESL
jgi:hypothetical protein